MKAVRYLFSLSFMMILLFIGSGFAYGTDAPMMAAEPTTVLLLGIALTIIGSFGCRRFIKKS